MYEFDNTYFRNVHFNKRNFDYISILFTNENNTFIHIHVQFRSCYLVLRDKIILQQ